MSIDFTGVNSVTIPEGSVSKITRKSDGLILWEKISVPAAPTLEEASWEFISEASKAGLASTYWAIGDQKNITVNGVTYAVDIIGFDHDTPTSTSTYGRSKAGITFQLHDSLDTPYKMNNSNTNSGGWKSSVMRTNTMTMLLNQLTSDLKAVIVPVDKVSGTGGGSSSGTETVSDSLFSLAEIEVFGSTSYSVSGEGVQYVYYKNGGKKIKNRDGIAGSWWLRSPRSKHSSFFCQININGKATNYAATSNIGVSFGFCV